MSIGSKTIDRSSNAIRAVSISQLIDFIRQFVRILVVEFELGLLGIEHSNGRLLLGGEIGRFALKLSEAAIVSVGEPHSDRYPFPTLLRDRLRLRREFLIHEPVEQRDVLQPAAAVILKARTVASVSVRRIWYGSS